VVQQSKIDKLTAELVELKGKMDIGGQCYHQHKKSKGKHCKRPLTDDEDKEEEAADTKPEAEVSLKSQGMKPPKKLKVVNEEPERVCLLCLCRYPLQLLSNHAVMFLWHRISQR
jgi:hypothetical protein